MAEETYESSFERLQAKKARASGRGVLGRVRPSPRQPLAFGGIHGWRSALSVLNSELHAVVSSGS